ASTDFGNVSFRVPGIHPVIKIAPHEVALHTREFATAAGSELARSAAADGAYGLAATVLDVQHDVRLAEAVAAGDTAAGGSVRAAPRRWRAPRRALPRALVRPRPRPAPPAARAPGPAASATAVLRPRPAAAPSEQCVDATRNPTTDRPDPRRRPTARHQAA